jgi:phosphoglycerate kinase
MAKKTVKDIRVRNKKVLVRVDFNVPLDKKTLEITDITRIKAAIPTIKYLVKHQAKVILFSHLGRVEKQEDVVKNSLKNVSVKLSELMNTPVIFIPVTRGKELEDAINNMQSGDIILVENTRYEDLDGKKESNNNEELGTYWASLGDIFVMDAFGSAHRAAASVSGIAKHIKRTVAGFLMEKEVKFLHDAVSEPSRPFIAILGGAKVSDKIGVIENLLKVADKILIGGGMAYTFYKAQGHEIGLSLLEEDKVDLAKELLKNPKIVVGVDCLASKTFEDKKGKVRDVLSIAKNEEGMDIGPKTIELFKSIIQDAKTIVWNGPLGVFEFKNYEKGTKEIAKAIASNKEAISIIGGGDSASAVVKFKLAKKFTHISTGGGASLEYLEGKLLPGVEAIEDKQ